MNTLSNMRGTAPHEALMEVCREIAGDAVWAIGMGTDKKGRRQWEVYCEDKQLAKQLPASYLGNFVHAIVAPRPTEEAFTEAKQREQEEKKQTLDKK